MRSGLACSVTHRPGSNQKCKTIKATNQRVVAFYSMKSDTKPGPLTRYHIDFGKTENVFLTSMTSTVWAIEKIVFGRVVTYFNLLLACLAGYFG